MTIGYILDDSLDRLDGVQQAVITIGEHMRKLGHDVHYIVAQTERKDLKNIHSVGKIVSLQFNGNSVRTPLYSSKKAIEELFDKVDFDVLHVQMPYSPFLAGRVLRMAPEKVKKVGTFHILPYNLMARYSTKILGFMMRRSLRSLDKAYGVSLPAARFMERSLKVPGDVLPNPVDYEFFSKFKKRPSKTKRIVYVGRFEERKGVRELVEAYAGVDRDLRRNTELVMCSYGPLHDEIVEKSRELGLFINFTGYVSKKEKAQYLANADIAVFPSTSGESFGIVLAEAMSAGSSVTLGGNNPGYASVLHEWPEALFDPKNTAEFTAKLTHFLTDPKSAHAIGAKQHTAVKHYDVKAVAERLLREAYS